MNVSGGFWWRWLVVATVVVLLLGAALVLFPRGMQQFFNLLFFGSVQGRVEFRPASAYLMFAFAVVGAALIGWATCMLVLLRGAFRRGSSEAWWAISASLLVWFVPDTAYSLLAGFWQNAVLNALIAAAFAVPLVATFPAHRKEPRA